jgi:hypothetical protein
MYKIEVHGCVINVAFRNYADFKSAVLTEIDKLSSMERLALDGTPTEDSSLFGSRQVIMYHILHTIRKYESTHQNFELSNFYYFVYSLANNYKQISNSAKCVYDVLISEFDSNFETIKLCKKNVSKDDVRMLYEFLSDTREQIELAYDSFIKGKCAELALKFSESGLEFYRDLDVFKDDFMIETMDMSSEIKKRRKKLQELRKLLK